MMHIEQSTLAGNLTVVSARLPDFESAAVVVVVRAGSRDERAENSGVAHFLEHMAFKGTKTRTALEISTDIECLGASINAFTSQEITAYHINGLKDSVGEAVAILGDVLTDSRYLASDVELERAVIAQEIARAGDDPHGLCMEGFIKVAFPGQSMGRPVLGDPEFVARADRGDLLGFIAANYVSGNMLVVGSGDIEHAAFCGLVSRHFGAIADAAPPGPRVAPDWGGGVSRLERNDFKQVNLSLGFPSVAAGADCANAHKMLGLALGNGMSSPLFQEVRQKRGLVYGVGAGSNHGTDFGLLAVQAGMTPDNLEECLSVICGELQRVTGGVQERDFTRARNRLLADLATVKERPFQLALYLAGQFFRDGTATGPQVDLDAVRAVTVADLRAAAEAIVGAAPSLSLVGPVPERDYRGMVERGLGRG